MSDDEESDGKGGGGKSSFASYLIENKEEAIFDIRPVQSVPGNGGGEYDRLIGHLRAEFELQRHPEVSVTLTRFDGELELHFRTRDQYLVGINDVRPSESQLSYTSMQEVPTISASVCLQALEQMNPLRLSDSSRHLRVLAQMTSEAARFYSLGEKFSKIINATPGSEAATAVLDNQRAMMMIHEYGDARKIQGLTGNIFHPILDLNAHLAVSQKAQNSPGTTQPVTLRNWLIGGR